MKKIILFSIVLLYNCGTNEVSSSQVTKLPNDIRWVTESPEYSILCEQTYKNAWEEQVSEMRTTVDPPYDTEQQLRTAIKQ